MSMEPHVEDGLLAERAQLAARIAEIDALLAAGNPGAGFTRPTAPTQTWSQFSIEEGAGSRIGEAWCSTWVRDLTFPNDLDRDAWADQDNNLYAVVRTWYYLISYGGGGYEVSACTAYQIATDPDDPDNTEIDRWLDYGQAAHGYHQDAELQALAVADAPPTVESWNYIVNKAGDDWAMLDTGDGG
jgi:hypothetical protein